MRYWLIITEWRSCYVLIFNYFVYSRVRGVATKGGWHITNCSSFKPSAQNQSTSSKQHAHCVFKEIERWLQSNVAPCKFLINDIHLYIISFPKTFIKSCTLHCHADINACMSKNWTACDMYSDNKSQSASFIAEFWHILQKFWGVYDRILTSYLLQRDG